MNKRVKIVCTIGPASQSPRVLEQLVRAGMNVARLNFSHGSYDNHAQLIRTIRQISAKVKKPVAILQDLQGPRIRVGVVPAAGIAVKKGQTVWLEAVGSRSGQAKASSATVIPVVLPTLATSVKAGERVLVDEGKLVLEVIGVSHGRVQCRAMSTATVISHKGLNFPDSNLKVSPLSTKDRADLRFGLEQGVDMVAISFVRQAAEVVALRKLIDQNLTRIKPMAASGVTKDYHPTIVVKIERPEGVANFEAILAVCDGVMIGRGDLALEIPYAQVPLAQKRIIALCRQQAKPVIVATQMLDSMIRQPMATRAEVSDVANAIFDGTDAIMLSGETAIGEYPIPAVTVMSTIAIEVEQCSDIFCQPAAPVAAGSDATAMLCASASSLAQQMGAVAIVCTSHSGRTARLIASHRPRVPVVCLTPLPIIAQQLCLSWGIKPRVMAKPSSLEALLSHAKKVLRQEGIGKKGDVAVVVTGHPLSYRNKCNTLKVITL